MALIGYCRCSTAEQNLQLQLNALNAAGVQRIFSDQGISGTKASRPELDHMLDHLRPGDEIIVYKLDRIARSTKHLLELVDLLQEKGLIAFESVVGA